MVAKASGSLGLPHSSYSATVSGRVASSMVFITSTKGTWERTTRKRWAAGGGGEVDDRAHEQTSGAAAFDGDAGGVAVAARDELLGGGDEVGEGVALDLDILPASCQASPSLAAAADVGVGHDDSAIQQREAGGARSRPGSG